jgi:phospholipase/carboxylesterase
MSLPPLPRITIEPKFTAQSCVIWLHGLGDSGEGFAPVVPVLGLPDDHHIRFVFPHAPVQAVTINQGMTMRSWYDIKSWDLNGRADITDVHTSEKLIINLIEEQIALGVPANKIVLAGFSQGGVMSLFTGLRYPEKLAGILALSCYLATGDKLPQGLSEANKNTPILQNHGNQDEVVPLAAGKAANTLLQTSGYNTQWRSYMMPHSVIQTQLHDISAWLQKQLAV